MKLLTLIGAGVLAGYCYKKMKCKKDDSTANTQPSAKTAERPQDITE